MKRADASGARYALLIGDEEAAAGTASVKPLRATGAQVAVPVAALAATLAAGPRTDNLNRRAATRRALHRRRKAMAVYDLEEQDQLEDLKAWWAQWGNYVTSVGLAVCVGVVGVQGWRWWKHSQAEQASVLYAAVSAAARGNDLGKAKDAMAGLADRFAGTGYAPRGGADRRADAVRQRRQGRREGAAAVGDRPQRRGQPEADRALPPRRSAVRRQAVRRRAAHARRQARRAFAGLYADLRGDMLAAAGKPTEARAAYQTAHRQARRQGAVSHVRAGQARCAGRPDDRAAGPDGRLRPACRWRACRCCACRSPPLPLLRLPLLRRRAAPAAAPAAAAPAAAPPK